MSECIYGCKDFDYVYDTALELIEERKTYKDFEETVTVFFEIKNRFIRNASLPKYLWRAIQYRKFVRSYDNIQSK